MVRPTEPIRVLIAEDDYLVREGARAVLDAEPGVAVVGTAGDPEGLRELLDTTTVDAVLLDIRMPPSYTTEGIDLALQLRKQHPHLGIVVLSQHADPEYVLTLLEGGSEGLAYLLKERLGDVEELVHSLAEVVGGGSVLDPKIVDGMLEARRRRAASRLAGLTEREMEVLGLMARGQHNAAIAERLYVSERSVEKHCNAIFRKLGLTEETDLNRRVAAVLFFLQRSPD
ncbi:MAG: response regulator transcription factor [Actinomycetota bacterium]|nr:response regulator transcription factor [Actinomycetota bacterium]